MMSSLARVLFCAMVAAVMGAPVDVDKRIAALKVKMEGLENMNALNSTVAKEQCSPYCDDCTHDHCPKWDQYVQCCPHCCP